MQDRKVLLGVIAILIGAAIFILAFSQREPQVSCGGGDGFCPKGCTFEQDSDCPRAKLTSVFEVRRCFVDSDCEVVKPICGNRECLFTDEACEQQCLCVSAINKDYVNTWNQASTTCTQTGAQCEPCGPLESAKAICSSGECRVILSS